MNTKYDPDLNALEKQLSQGQNIPAPPSRGLHQLIAELEATLDLAVSQLAGVKNRVSEFDRLQTTFYNGRNTAASS